MGRNFRIVVCSEISIDGEKNDETSFCSRAWAWRQGWYDAGGKKALEQSEVICGYTAYADLIREDYPEKEYLVSGMTKEVERCHMALLAAQDGKTTAMICSGDAGVYGMAGLVLSLAEKYPETEVVIVAGVTAALSGAARLGAPLMNDFAVISLSDLLTPKDVIEKRLRAAAAGDFPFVCTIRRAKSGRTI